MQFYKLLIDGALVDTGRYKFFPRADASIHDPLTVMKMQRELAKGVARANVDDVFFAKYCLANEELVKRAVRAAHNASEIFRDFSFSKRKKIMQDIHEILLGKRRDIIDLMIVEGHPERLAAWEFAGMEMAYRSESIEFFKSQLRGSYGVINGESLGWIRKPDGVVVVSPPGNASCSNSLTAGFALLAGNTIIVKPPLRAPIATLYLWHEVIWNAVKANGAPNGTVNTVVGNSNSIMEVWMNSPMVSDIYFFGDSAMGLKIGARAFESGKKPILELSGNDIMIVWKDGDVEAAADSLMDAFLGSTQICMVPKKALIHPAIYDAFESAFLDKVASLSFGLPSEKNVCLTPVVRIDDYSVFLKDAILKGAKLLCGGARADHVGNQSDNGMYILPTVLRVDSSERTDDMLCVREENFFPLIPLVRMQDDVGDKKIFEAMVRMVNQNRYGLRTSIWVESSYFMAKFVKKLNTCGLLRVNSKHTDFSPYLSTHGGPGLSGGPFGEANYVWQKTTHLQSVSVMSLGQTRRSK